MQAGNYDEALRRVTDQLSAEFTDPEVPQFPGTRGTSGKERGMPGLIGPEDEALVARLREVLAGIVTTLGARNEEVPKQAIKTVLDGSEFVIRSELLAGNADGVLRLLPSSVFLVAVLVTDQDHALELSRRTAQLIEQFGV